MISYAIERYDAFRFQRRLKQGGKFTPEQTEELASALDESRVQETVEFATKDDVDHKDNKL